MIPPESSGASRTKVAWCNLGRLAVLTGRSGPSRPESARPTGRPATVPATSGVRRRRVVRLHTRLGGPPRVRAAPRPRRPVTTPRRTHPERSRLPARPAPSGHVPSAEPRPADASRPLDAPHAARPDHSRRRRQNQPPIAAPPSDGSHDLGETHAARRATPHTPAGRPAPRPPRAPPAPRPADRSRLPARTTPSGHVPSAGPRPTDGLRPLDAPDAARPDHSRRRRQNHLPLAAPPRDGSRDLGETHAARRATPRPPTAREEP